MGSVTWLHLDVGDLDGDGDSVADVGNADPGDDAQSHAGAVDQHALRDQVVFTRLIHLQGVMSSTLFQVSPHGFAA